MRGWSQESQLKFGHLVVLPAHAGVILQAEVADKIIKKYYPHMRGWSYYNGAYVIDEYVLPAHAGVILPSVETCRACGRITRTCGGDLDPGTLTDGNSTNFFVF